MRMWLPLLVLLVLWPFSLAAEARTIFEFDQVVYHTCYDGDTCMVSLPGVHPFFGDHILIRIDGIDTPEIKGKCEREQRLARDARDFLRDVMQKASNLRLINVHRDKYFRIDATVLADGVDVAELMISKGYAVQYDGGNKTAAWCADGTDSSQKFLPDADVPETQLPKPKAAFPPQ